MKFPCVEIARRKVEGVRATWERVVQKPTIYAAWYLEADWPAWKALCPDMKNHWSEWMAWSEKQMPEFRRQGMSVEPATIRPEGFAAWAKKNGRGLGSNDRATYAAMVGQGQTDAPMA